MLHLIAFFYFPEQSRKKYSVSLQVVKWYFSDLSSMRMVHYFFDCSVLIIINLKLKKNKAQYKA